MRKLTITVEDEVYSGLLEAMGRRRISGFLNDLAKPHVLKRELDAEYRAMAADLDAADLRGVERAIHVQLGPV